MWVVFTADSPKTYTITSQRSLLFCDVCKYRQVVGHWHAVPHVCNKLPIFKSQNVFDILSLENWTVSCHKMSVRTYKLTMFSIPEQQWPQQRTLWYSPKSDQVHHNSNHYTVHCYYFPRKIFCEITLQTAPALWRNSFLVLSTMWLLSVNGIRQSQRPLTAHYIGTTFYHLLFHKWVFLVQGL